ncbi:N-acetylglucosamine kinase [Flexivirga oryzae]|uniref:N-acetylglucosamine kinase-like BadF-type ATPase n=1 Tax=Flexivirga oryzae TaxID=1794944 RepID=A0A839N8S3_9MICO|nr:BadF/BadG/BcrA/BcrD ATPase family protein [Flexivirga oryzae]MBB2891052.1 N-acetylglucosamine kinase-like BadF-type ATPase [Flexivirga oryzae]
MDLFLTLDAGGTSTRAVVHDATGTCLGYAVGSGGNPTASGVETASATMRSTTAEALEHAGAQPKHVGHALAAMAGSTVRLAGVDDGLRALGVPVPLHLGSDIEAMFFSGTAALDGAALVSGTGAAAIVVTNGTTTARSDGRGWLLGDAGSGYWIAHHLVRAVTADLDHRGPRTALTDALLSAAGVASGRTDDKDALLDQLVSILYAIPTPGIARFAPLAFDLADSDAVAEDIVQTAAEGLADTVLALPSADRSAPLVVGGSVLFHQPGLRSLVAELLRGSGWTGPVNAVSDGTAGAMSMNLRSAGVVIDESSHARMLASLADVRTRS